MRFGRGIDGQFLAFLFCQFTFEGALSMSKKLDSNTTEYEADVKSPEAVVLAKPRSRRDLLNVFLPAAAAAAAVACSGTNLKGANGENNSGKPKSLPAGAGNPSPNGNPAGAGNPSPNGNPVGDPKGTPEPDATDPAGIPTDTTVPAAGIPKTKDTDVALTVDSKIYGTAQSAMLVAKIPGLMVGDQIVVGFPVGDNVQVISRRTVQSHDLLNPVVIDNINLYGNKQLDIYIYSANCARKHGVIKTGEDDLKLARTFNGKAVVDARSISLPPSGYDGAHPNFFTMMPILNWTEPAAGQFVAFKRQRTSGRPFKVAKANAMWGVPGHLLASNVTICDALGVEIAGAKAATSNFIAKHSMFIVYLLDTADSNHYHRYFYFVG